MTSGGVHPTISEMLEMHPDIEYICLIWVWEQDDQSTRFLQYAEDTAGRGSLLHKPYRLDEEYSYIGPYIDQDDKDRFLRWVDDYGMNENYDNLSVSEELLIGSAHERGVRVKCLRGCISEECLDYMRKYDPDFEFVSAEIDESYPYAIYDESAFDSLYDPYTGGRR